MARGVYNRARVVEAVYNALANHSFHDCAVTTNAHHHVAQTVTFHWGWARHESLISFEWRWVRRVHK